MWKTLITQASLTICFSIFHLYYYLLSSSSSLLFSKTFVGNSWFWLPERIMVKFESPSVCVTQLTPLCLSGLSAISDHQRQIANKLQQFLGGSLPLPFLSGSQCSLPSQVHEANTNGALRLLSVAFTILSVPCPSISTD